MLYNLLDKLKHNKILFKEGKKITKCEEYLDKVMRYNYLLQKQYDLKKNERIMVISKNSSESAALYLSIMANGGILVPINANQSINYYKKVIDDCKPKLIFSNENLGLNELLIKTPIRNGCYPKRKINENDVSVLMYTSGTSGKPKGVQLTHLNIKSNVKSMPKIVEEGESSFSFLPWSHTFGFTCELNYMMDRGGIIKICQDQRNLMEELKENSPEHIFTVPQLLIKIEQKITKLPFYQRLFVNKKHVFGENIKNIAIGGASTPVSTIKMIKSMGINVYNGYGLTETSPLISLNDCKTDRLNSVGKSIENVDIKIIHGEICVKGPNLMKGYWNQEDHKGYFWTGDKGYLDSENFLYVQGRIDERYKLKNGFFIYPNYIEDLLLKNHDIEQIFIYGKDRQYNIALVYSKLDEEQIMKYIMNHPELKNYEKPKKIKKIKEPFSVDNHLLTAKFTLKRNLIYLSYKNQIDNLYENL